MSASAAKLLRAYVDDLHVRYSERTVPEYLSHVQSFLGWLLEHGVELHEARSQDLLAYQKELSAMRKSNGKLYSVGFQINRLNAVRSLYRCLYRLHFLVHDPAASLELPRAGRTLPRTILTKKEAARILDKVQGISPYVLRDRAILEVLYATGIRVSELTNLTPGHVDTEERVLHVVRGKGKKDRNLPLTQPAARAIEAYLLRGRAKLLGSHPRRELFIGDRGGRLHRAIVNKIVQYWAKQARVKKHITCHTFRHSVATHLLQGRADIRHIQALLGHASLSTTQIYTRVEISDLKQVVARAHPRGR